MSRLLLMFTMALLMPIAMAPGASAEDSPLRGLKQIAVLIDGLDADADRCGITESLISDAFSAKAQRAGLDVVTGASHPRFYVQINTLEGDDGLCITAVKAQAYNYQKVQLEYADTPTYATVELWTTGTVSYSSPERHARQIKKTIEGMTDKFIAKWTEANEVMD